MGRTGEHSLSDHSDCDHADLRNIGADDHHAQSHTHGSHSSIGADDHHAQSHTHGSHSSIGADDHHAQSHNFDSHSDSDINIGSGYQVKIGGTATRVSTEGTNAITLFNGTQPIGNLTNGATFYVKSGEMWVADSGGSHTQLSPHSPDTGEWIFHSKNPQTGRVLKIKMEQLVKRLVETFGWDLVEEYYE